jgi:hypothetical protein
MGQARTLACLFAGLSSVLLSGCTQGANTPVGNAAPAAGAAPVANAAPASNAAAAQPTGRIPSIFVWYYDGPPNGSNGRYWTRTSPTRWTETMQSGGSDDYVMHGPGAVNGCNGLVMQRDDNAMQAFVPDSNCARQVLLFRNLPEQANTWADLGAMQDIRY